MAPAPICLQLQERPSAVVEELESDDEPTFVGSPR